MFKSIKLTDDEIRTLLWALEAQHARTILNNVRNGRPARDDVTKRLCSISHKAYCKLVGAKEETA